uniref:NADH-ubiquinone oxidoreductase chain 2 n=1 Tax=Ibidoecus plataleae TaxID=3004258 RepID=A0A9E9ES57_9NEOP|nr:NADH dehydrogenase subunit 2 [Ibidoecus plataleae]
MKLVIMLLLLMVVTAVVFCASNWFQMWVLIELGTLFFIPQFSSNQKRVAAISSWKYYVVQSVSSSIMMMGILLMTKDRWLFWEPELGYLVFSLSVMIKLGVPPFHSWMFHVSEMMDWFSFGLLNSVMKVPALICVFFMVDSSQVWLLAMMVSSLFSSFCLSDFSIRRFLLFSSILNVSWLMMSCLVSKWVFVEFITLYSVMMILVCADLKSESASSFVSFVSSSEVNTNLCFMVNIASMSGVPPFASFLLKLEVLSMSDSIVSMVMLLFSAVLMFMYMYFIFVSLISTKSSLSRTNKLPFMMVIHTLWMLFYF